MRLAKRSFSYVVHNYFGSCALSRPCYSACVLSFLAAGATLFRCALQHSPHVFGAYLEGKVVAASIRSDSPSPRQYTACLEGDFAIQEQLQQSEACLEGEFFLEGEITAAIQHSGLEWAA